VAAGFPSRSEDDLSEEERRQLMEAHAELRAAVAAYEPFIGQELRREEPVPIANATELREAQERVDAAEGRLWELREKLLGWARPAWVPRASLVSDWFSDDDAVYDQVTDPAHP
jgi:hypothetical protein